MPECILRQMAPVDTRTHYFFRIGFKMILPFVLTLQDFDPNVVYISRRDHACYMLLSSAESNTRCENLVTMRNKRNKSHPF